MLTTKLNREHSFDTELAEIHGIEKAILLKNFDYWVRENERRQLEEFFFNGQYWTAESFNSLCKKYRYMKKPSVHRWLEEMVNDGWLNRVKRVGDVSFYRPGKVFEAWNNGQEWQVFQNGTPGEKGKEVFQNGTVSVPKWNSKCSKMEYNNIDCYIDSYVERETNVSQRENPKIEKIDLSTPVEAHPEKAPPSCAAPPRQKRAKKETPADHWPKRAAKIFDEVNQEKAQAAQLEYIPYEWSARRGQDFKSLKEIKGMVEKAMAAKNIEPTPENTDNSFRMFFSYGFDYLHDIANRLGGPVAFNPSTLQRNYNNIRQFSTNKLKAHATHRGDNTKANATSGPNHHTGIDVQRAMDDVNRILADRQFMESLGVYR